MNSKTSVGWLLLRDGHSIPLSALSPDALKEARGNTIERPGIRLKHTSGLNAVVDSLGFKGDFGDYKTRHWPKLQEQMAGLGLRERRNLFNVPLNRLGFGSVSLSRRALADRLFLGPRPIPRRVFLGTDHDWAAWEELFHTVGRTLGTKPPPLRDLEVVRSWVYSEQDSLSGFHNFLGDQLLDPSDPARITNKIYFEETMDRTRVEQDLQQDLEVMKAFRWFIDKRDDGWVEVIPVTDSLVFLKEASGDYDFIWRNLREEPPPDYDPDLPVSMLQPVDMPSSMLANVSFESWYYQQHDLWDEKVRHEAEKHYYASGGRMGLSSYPGGDEVRHQYLLAQRAFPDRSLQSANAEIPENFIQITLEDGKRLLVSELVSIRQMREMMAASGYGERRMGDLWEPGNSDDPEHLPTAATWYDAQAYCAWMELQHGVRVRLPNFNEYREWFPKPDLREYIVRAPVGVKKLEKWGGVEGNPERIKFETDLQWTTSSKGLRAVYAQGVSEWVQNNKQLVVNPVMDYPVAPHCWGAYKGAKVGFRLVMETE